MYMITMGCDLWPEIAAGYYKSRTFDNGDYVDS